MQKLKTYSIGILRYGCTASRILFGSSALCLLSLFLVISSLMMTSCKGKQKGDEEWVDSVLQACDSIPEDTLVYDTEEQAPGETVDENFNDFIYAFTHNGEFQFERIVLPMKVLKDSDTPIRWVRSTGDFHKEFKPTSKDYYLMLLSDVNDMEQDPDAALRRASLHLLDVPKAEVRSFDFDRKDTVWKLRSEQVADFDEHPMSSFLTFYQHFATDTVFQVAHISHPLMISMPSEEDASELVQGTIDPSQFSIFVPQMPNGQIMVIDYRRHLPTGKRVVLVKCGMASSMMDIFTFEQDGGVWRLVSLEE